MKSKTSTTKSIQLIFSVLLLISVVSILNLKLVYADIEPNDDIDHAEPISAGESMSGNLYGCCQTDYKDVYAFTMPSDGSLQMSFSAGGDWYNQGSGTIIHVAVDNTICCGEIYYSSLYPSGSTVNFPQIAAGTILYITFTGSFNPGSGYYSFIINSDYVSEPNDIEPNDTKAAASSMLFNSSKTGHLGFILALGGVSTLDGLDYYSFHISDAGSMSLNVSMTTTIYESNPASSDLEIIDSSTNNSLLQASGTDFYQVSNLHFNPGTYYLKLHAYQSGIGYTVSNTFAADFISPTVSILPSGSIIVCKPATVLLTANITGTPVTYQWKKGNTLIAGANNSAYTATKSGTYKCVVNNACGSATSNVVSVTINPQPTAIISAPNGLDLCGLSSVLLQANTGAGFTYQWVKANSSISGATGSSYSATTKGTYKVIVTNSNNCSKTAAGKKVIKTCKEESLIVLNEGIIVFPNPSSGNFTMNFTSGALDESVAIVEVLNLVGQTVFEQELPLSDGELMTNISLSDIPLGIYLVRVIAKERIYQQKLIIQ